MWWTDQAKAFCSREPGHSSGSWPSVCKKVIKPHSKGAIGGCWCLRRLTIGWSTAWWVPAYLPRQPACPGLASGLRSAIWWSVSESNNHPTRSPEVQGIGECLPPLPLCQCFYPWRSKYKKFKEEKRWHLLLLLPLPRVVTPSSVPEELPVSARFSTPPDRVTPPYQIIVSFPILFGHHSAL